MKKKILFIENNAEYQEVLTELLEASGYHVTCAKTISEAWELIKNEFFHLMISDIRMEDDQNPLDESGMDWLHENSLADLPKILITAHPTFEKAEKAFGLAEAMVGKTEPVKIIAKVNEVFDKSIYLAWSLEIVGEKKTSILLDTAAFLYPQASAVMLAKATEEIGNLLCGLFHDKEKVRLQDILWRRDERVALLIHVFSKGRRSESRIAICGQSEAILKEIEGFKDYGHDIKAGNTSLVGQHYKTHRLSALSYRLIDGELDTLVSLKDCFRHRPIERVKAILTDFYANTLEAWHQTHLPEMKEMSLDQWVGTQYFPDRAQFVQKLKENMATMSRFADSEGFHWSQKQNTIALTVGKTKAKYTDPIDFFEKELSEINVLLANSPGYMRGRNILTDGKAETWLTDFKDAGPRPMICDYAALEASIRYDWSHFTPTTAMALETALQQSGLTPIKADHADDEIQRALEAISVIRSQYRDKGGDHNAYHQAMFLHALIRIANIKIENGLLPSEIRRFGHLVLSSAMLSHVLQGNETPKPQQIAKESGITIDERHSTININGREFRLSENRFTLFKFLYNLKGKPASRGDLGRAVWGKDYDPDAKAGINLMNTTILRLREQIEKDARNPEVIQTTDGGYKLTE